jgi:hypothetical protein
MNPLHLRDQWPGDEKSKHGLMTCGAKGSGVFSAERPSLFSAYVICNRIQIYCLALTVYVINDLENTKMRSAIQYPERDVNDILFTFLTQWVIIRMPLWVLDRSARFLVMDVIKLAMPENWCSPLITQVSEGSTKRLKQIRSIQHSELC